MHQFLWGLGFGDNILSDGLNYLILGNMKFWVLGLLVWNRVRVRFSIEILLPKQMS